LDVSEDEDGEVVAYLSLPAHPGDGKAVVKKNVRLRDVLGDYTGPDLFLDFDENNVLLGIELLD
jgi:hypothetical protein